MQPALAAAASAAVSIDGRCAADVGPGGF